MNLPNLISMGRLLSVPVIVWLILDERMTEAFWLFLAAGISDALDGYMAKRMNAETTFGRYLDPLADKALLVCVYISLSQSGNIATWLVIMVVFRDVLIIGGAILFQSLTRSLTMEPYVISKVNTLVQIILATVVLAVLGLDIQAAWLIDAFTYAVAATTFASGAVYVVEWSRRAAIMEDGE